MYAKDASDDGKTATATTDGNRLMYPEQLVDSSSGTPSPVMTDPWSRDITTYILGIRRQCLDKTSHLRAEGQRRNGWENYLRLPSIAIPAVFGPLVLLLDQMNEPTASIYVSTVGFTATSVCTALLSYYDYGAEAQNLFTCATKYEEIAVDIDAEMAKKKEYRTVADVFMTQIKMKYVALNQVTPSILG